MLSIASDTLSDTSFIAICVSCPYSKCLASVSVTLVASVLSIAGSSCFLSKLPSTISDSIPSVICIGSCVLGLLLPFTATLVFSIDWIPTPAFLSFRVSTLVIPALFILFR